MEKNLKLLLQKYKTGKLSLSEDLLLAEIIADPSIAGVDNHLQKDFSQCFESSENEIRNLDHVLHEIHHRLNIKQSEKKKTPVYQLYHWASRVAAIFFIPLLMLSLFLLLNNKTPNNQEAMFQVVVPEGARVNFELPDGTTGFLNSGSKLIYSSVFTVNREVHLFGEAYFNVAHDQLHPFMIEANGNEIQVVGTKFNLTAYPHEMNTELVLEEGKVLFKSSEMKSAVDILPGQRLIEKNGKVKLTDVEPWKYSAWKEGKLVFRNDSMEELARRISHWYNVDVEINDEGLEAYTFRGVFEDDPLEEVLRLLKMTSPIDYRIQNRQENTDGTFSRKKVVITKKNES